MFHPAITFIGCVIATEVPKVGGNEVNDWPCLWLGCTAGSCRDLCPVRSLGRRLGGEVPVCVQREGRWTAAHCTRQPRQEPQGALALIAPTSEALRAPPSSGVLQEWLRGHRWGETEVRVEGAGLGSGLLPSPSDTHFRLIYRGGSEYDFV